MSDDIRGLIARLLDATGAESEVRTAGDADAALGLAARRRGGDVAFAYEVYRTKVARADVRSGQIKAVLDAGRAAAFPAPDPGHAPVGPLHTR
jgi:hypothetical protein